MKLLLAYLLVVGAWDKPEGPLPPLHLAAGLPGHSQCVWAFREAVYWESSEFNPRRPGWWLNLDERKEIWQMAELATNPLMKWADRRRALARLAELAGWRAVVTGELPPPVPLEWYREQ